MIAPNQVLSIKGSQSTVFCEASPQTICFFLRGVTFRLFVLYSVQGVACCLCSLGEVGLPWETIPCLAPVFPCICGPDGMAAPSRRPRPKPTSPPARCDFDRCVCPLTLTGQFCALLGSGSWHAGAAVAIFLEFVWQTATNGLAHSARTPGRPRAPLGPPIELVSPFIGFRSQRL